MSTPTTELVPSVDLTENFFTELQELGTAGTLPLELSGLLRSMIANQKRCMVPETATPTRIRLAKQHLGNGVRIKTKEGFRWYNLVVFVPDPGSIERRSFFLLQPRYPGGTVKRLEEL